MFYRTIKIKKIKRLIFFYFKANEGILYSRFKFQKHKLKNILENFDKNLTAEQNMFLNKYRKIYDSGNIVFSKFYK